MVPVTTVAATAATSETAAVGARALEARQAPSEVLENETCEAEFGDSGIREQLDDIRHTSHEAIAARNDSLLRTRNGGLEGLPHPETGVRFVKATVTWSDGGERIGVFPEFESKFDAQLPQERLNASDYQQARCSNEQLARALEADPTLAKRFNEAQLRQIRRAETPEGCVWHHHQEAGRMQLVDHYLHLRTAHGPGGREIWGGGSTHR